VPIATLKHYLREGLIAPTRKSGKTMSWYDPELANKIRSIKELQRRQYLPLDVISKTIERHSDAPDDFAAADAIAKVLSRNAGRRSRTREEVIARGADPRELDFLAAAGLAIPHGPKQEYGGDDLALLSTLGAARKAGITAEMLPLAIVNRYLAAVRTLVEVELEMFRAGVLPGAAPKDVKRLTTAATQLSERLVVLVRRKLLLPTLERLTKEHPHAEASRNGRARGRSARRPRARS
jgi:DNA-binding transcriptional MerR regulator